MIVSKMLSSHIEKTIKIVHRVFPRISATGGGQKFSGPPPEGGDIWGGTGPTGGGHEGGDRSAQGGTKNFARARRFSNQFHVSLIFSLQNIIPFPYTKVQKKLK